MGSLTSIINRNIILVIMVGLASCSPVKGYLGPDLPKEQLAIIYYQECGSRISKIRASAEGVEFGSSGVSLIPGKHGLDSFVDLLGLPYDCVPQTVFDQYGYQSCLNRRFQAQQKNNRYLPNCYVGDYQKTTYSCNQLFKQYLCSSSVTVESNKEYDYCVYQVAGFVRAKISERNSTQAFEEVECTYSSEEVRRVEFSYRP